MSRTVAALVLLLALAACGTDSEASDADEPTAAGETEEPEVRSAPGVTVGRDPVGVAAGDGDAVWVVSFGTSELARIRPGDTEPDLTVHVGDTPLRVVEAFASVWLTTFDAGELVRVDPGTGEITDRVVVGEGAEGVTAGFGSVWVVAQDAGELVRVDPRTRKVTDRIDIGEGARLVSAGPEAMYVGQFADDEVLRIDPATNDVRSSGELCSGPQDTVALAGVVWVACTFSDEVLGLDPETLEVTTRVKVSGSPDPILVTDDGRLFVVAEAGPTVHELDPGSGEILWTETLSDAVALYDNANVDAAVAAGEIWVSSVSHEAVFHTQLP